jgi:hypothetical protein
MAIVVVEYTFDPPMDDAAFNSAMQKSGWCFESQQARWLMSLLGQDRRRRLCIFDAPDAESVRRAYHLAGVPIDRAWTAEQIGGPAALIAAAAT